MSIESLTDWLIDGLKILVQRLRDSGLYFTVVLEVGPLPPPRTIPFTEKGLTPCMRRVVQCCMIRALTW